MYSRCPCSTAVRASNYLKETGIADTAFFGPEAEFFVFDDVMECFNERYFYQVDSDEGPYNSGNTLTEEILDIGHL